MDDLLKEAIADAKAVRETALQNAKIALEEAFTPKLQSMLSKKIQSEVESEEEGEYEEDEEGGEEEAPAPEAGGEEGGEGEKDVDVEVPEDSEEEGEEEVPAEEAEEVPAEEDEEETDEDLDLEAIIRELEAEEEGGEEEPAEEGDEEEVDETIEVNGVRYQPIKEEEDEDGEEVAENNDVSSGIGTGDNKQPAPKANKEDTEDPEGDSTNSQKMGEGLGTDTANTSDRKSPGKEVEEEVDLEEVLKMLGEDGDDDDDEGGEEVAAENTQLKSDLGEHRKVIKFLKSKLNEVNLLNAKLLFTNKLFKNFNLSNDQKMRVVETFDRASSLREVKLVYSTIAESFGYAGSNTISKSYAITENASKPIASTKSSKKVISEGEDMAARFKKLAGIL